MSALGTACTHIPSGRTSVHEIAFEGNDSISEEDIEERLATQETPKFLGLFRGVVFDYQLLDRRVVAKDVARVVRYYRSRGYYEAKVRELRTEEIDASHTRVVMVVQEGDPVRVAAVELLGLGEVTSDAKAAIAAALDVLPVGSRLDEQKLYDAERQILEALTDHGYAYAQAQRQARVDLPRHLAYVWYRIEAGPRTVVGDIQVQCATPHEIRPVLRALDIQPGDPYSTASIRDARDALLGLGVFSNVEIEPQLASGPSRDARVPLVIKLTTMKPRTLKLGAGVALDAVRTDFHLRAGWEHQNFLGGYRRFAAEVKPGVVLYPTRIPSLNAPEHYLPEVKSSVQVRQPGFIEARTWGAIRTEYNIFPLLLSPDVDPNASVLGYREFKGAAGVERRYRRLFGTFYYNIQRNSPFAYVRMLDPALRGITISYVDLRAELDLTDSRTAPHAGLLLSGDVQTAGGPLMGDARDVRVQPELRIYLPLGHEKFTFALRGTVGFLFPFNYAETLSENAASGRPGQGVSRERWVEDVQLLYFRGFFSGGPNSNRGYATGGVGPHGVVPFLNPDLASINGCDPSSPGSGAVRCNQPLGGPSLWETTGELRFPLSGPLTGAGFCDLSDVSPHERDLRLQFLHMSCGAGARYATPVGPIRLDIGYRMPGLQILGSSDKDVEGNPGTIFGLPMAISLGIGEAF
ncbi:MAG: BamA/TamA family outer membrane protein [Polyangiaceae bacterium]|nr:BamA/TamA family outer membrane protein [Polyangiaceae bacterium]